MTKKTYEISRELNKKEREKLNKYSDILAKLLFHRGLEDNASATDFIDADYDKGLHDPFLMKDLEEAVTRILRAVEKNEKICIFSDYDADGVSGAVVLNDFFKKINYDNFFVYIPHRNLEGFGLNKNAINEIEEKKASLIVTIDCGIADLDEIDFAKQKGIDVIVTDHHEPAHGIPKAYAVVDPMRGDCEYSYKYLCGAGVIFKVVQGLIKKIQKNETLLDKELIQLGWEKWLLDMVGVATLSDMVPLTGENRVFAKYGLLVLQKSPRKGLVELISKSFANQKSLNEEDVVFTITPRINAASRMGHPEAAFKMLSTTDDAEAAESVKYLEKINNERKGVVAGMVKKIKKHVEDDLIKDGKLTVPVIVLGNPNWSPSLLGLAASSIVDTYNCPVFLWGRGEGEELKGSCRSDGSASVVSIMTDLPKGILTTFGGHVMAGGFVLEFSAIDKIDKVIINSYKKISSENTNLFHKIVDEKLTIDDLSMEFYNELDQLAPFGVKNEKPIFLFENIKLESFEKFGKDKNHGKLIFNKTDGSKIEAIKFFIQDNPKIENLKAGDLITFTANLEKSVFGGRVELRMKLVELY